MESEEVAEMGAVQLNRKVFFLTTLKKHDEWPLLNSRKRVSGRLGERLRTLFP